MSYLFKYDSPIGLLTIASDGENITELWLEGEKYPTDHERVMQDLPVFRQVEEWLTLYFKGENPSFIPPLAPKGTEFRQAVWQHLVEIPYGQVVSYGELAKKVASQMGKEKMSAQAIGGAVGHNPISILIPCHRVIGRDGRLVGYAGGLDKKIKLLTLERAPFIL